MAAIMATAWVLAGCCGLPQRCDTHPCWYDESKGPGAPYYDPTAEPGKQHYYLGRDPTNLNRVVRLYPSTGTVAPNPYVYQPGSGSWMSLYRWSIIRPYLIPQR